MGGAQEPTMYENSLSRDLLNAEVEYRMSRTRADLAGRRTRSARRALGRGRRTGSAGAADPR
jgi:hypothetical protein